MELKFNFFFKSKIRKNEEKYAHGLRKKRQAEYLKELMESS